MDSAAERRAAQRAEEQGFPTGGIEKLFASSFRSHLKSEPKDDIKGLETVDLMSLKGIIQENISSAFSSLRPHCPDKRRPRSREGTKKPQHEKCLHS